MEREIVLVGLSHHTAPVELREQVAFGNARLEPALRELLAVPGVTEGVILSTCNRVEVVACGGNPNGLTSVLPEFLAQEHGVGVPVLASHLYTLQGREAVRHLFRVAASLDSMIVGEPQILGQMKEQYQTAAALGASGPVLHRAFHKAFSVAKRVRNETGIAQKAVSVGSAACDLARGIFDTMQDKTALLLGAGAMGELTARQLLGHGVSSLLVANRTFDRAVELARELGGVPVPLERVARYLPLADLIVGAAGGAEFLLDARMLEEAMRERRRRPMFLIDLAVPRSIDPAVNDQDGVYLYDIDDLEGVIADNRGARAEEAVKAEGIIDGEVDAFWHWLEGLDVIPTIVALREKVDAIRRRELVRHEAALAGLEPAERAAVERVTTAIVNKILHMPMTALKRLQAGDADSNALEAARRLFRLGVDPDEEED